MNHRIARLSAATAALSLLSLLSLAAIAQDAAAPAVAPAAAAAAASAPVATPATFCVDVEVQNVRPQQGQLFLAAYGTAETYNKKPMAAVKVPAGDATTRLQMCGISGDTLAITMYQDLDSDGKMGKNLMGMPTEPWGSSGAPSMFGPTWQTGSVKLGAGAVVVKLSQ